MPTDEGTEPELKTRQRQLLDRVITVLEAEPINTPTPQIIAQGLGIPRQAVEQILRIGLNRKEVVKVDDAVFYTPRQIDQLKARIIELAAGQPFNSNDIRDQLQTTRKYVQPLLDYFDEIGWTIKEGTTRTFMSAEVESLEE